MMNPMHSVFLSFLNSTKNVLYSSFAETRIEKNTVGTYSQSKYMSFQDDSMLKMPENKEKYKNFFVN